MQGHLQATIVARVAYVLLHTFILSTVFRCKADMHGSWFSHTAYIAGLCVAVLCSIALYVALTVMDPGYLPAVHGLKLQVISSHHTLSSDSPHMNLPDGCSVNPQLQTSSSLQRAQEQNQDERETHQAGGGQGIHLTGSSRARSSSQGLAAAPAFDLEELLQGAAMLPSTHGPAPYASPESVEPDDEVSVDRSVPDSRTVSAKMEWTEPGQSCSVRNLRSLKVRAGAATFYHEVWR